MKYGIIGSGSANPKVVQDGLLDLLAKNPDAQFVIHARRSPQGAVGTVYDFLVDNEVPFDAAHRIDDNAPKALLNLATTLETTEDPTEAVIQMSDEVLILWDEADPKLSEKLAIRCADAGRLTFDLTMALTPIMVDTAPKVEVLPEPVVVEEAPMEIPAEMMATAPEVIEVSPFTRDELLSMSMGILRRQAKSLGIDKVFKTKEEIADAIFYNEPTNGDPIIASMIDNDDTDMTAEELDSLTGNGMLVWTHLTDGDMVSRDLTPAEVLKILELLGPIKH